MCTSVIKSSLAKIQEAPIDMINFKNKIINNEKKTYKIRESMEKKVQFNL